MVAMRKKVFSFKFCFSTIAVEYNRAELKHLIGQLSLYCGIEAPKISITLLRVPYRAIISVAFVVSAEKLSIEVLGQNIRQLR